MQLSKFNLSDLIQNRIKKQIAHFVKERVSKAHPKISPTNLTLSILSDRKMPTTRYTDAYWDTLSRNADLLIKHMGEERLNECVPLIHNSFLRLNVDLLKSFGIQITPSNLVGIGALRLMDNEELKKTVLLDDSAPDLVEHRLQMIDYLTEAEKTEMFRQDKDQLLQLNLVALNDVMNARLMEKFFTYADHLNREELRKSFLNLNAILRTYSKFTRRKKHFLDHQVLKRLNADFFNQIINDLPDDYFDSFVNITKLNKFFCPRKRTEDNFRFIRQHLPSLTTLELIDLLSLDYQQKHFECLVGIFLRTFDLDREHAYELLFRFVEHLPRDPETIGKLIKKLMSLPDQLDELELVKAFLQKQASRKSNFRFKSNLSLMQTILKRDHKFIYRQLKDHPFYNKISLGNVSQTIQYLLDEGLTLDQINAGLKIILYSLELVQQNLEILKQEEIFERIKHRNNFLDYLLYYIERDSAFTGKAVFYEKMDAN